MAKKIYLIGSVLYFAVILMVCFATCAFGQDDALLNKVYDGCQNAVMSITSGSGTVTVHCQEENNGETRKTQTVYKIAFSGDKYLIQQGDTLTAIGDGKVTKFTPVKGIAEISNMDPGKIQRGQAGIIREVSVFYNRGLYNIGASVESPNMIDKGAKVASRDILDGAECIVVERTALEKVANATLTETYKLWVCPDKGYTVVKSQIWIARPEESLSLFSEVVTDVQKYGDIWAPKKTTETFYSKDGKTYRQRITTYSSDFRINCPITDADVALKLPSGTHVYDWALDTTYVIP